MGFTTIGPSAADRAQSEKERATNFASNAKKLTGVVPLIKQSTKVLRETTLKRNNVLGALEQLRQNLREVSMMTRGHGSSVRPFGVTENIRFAYNLLDSLAGALQSLNAGKAISELKVLADYLDKVCDGIERAYTANRNVVSPAGQNSVEGERPKDELENTDESDVPESLADFDTAGMSSFSSFDNIMPGKENPEVVKLFELPVIATFNRQTSVEELGERGFEAVSMAGYLVLRKAYIIGINVDRCNADKLDPYKVVDKALEKLSESLNDKLGLICEDGVRYHKGGWLFFWYGPKGYRNNLFGRNVTLYPTEFQFPFGK